MRLIAQELNRSLKLKIALKISKKIKCYFKKMIFLNFNVFNNKIK